jgi:hypothetical protein
VLEAGVVHGGGVVDGDGGALALHGRGDVEGGAVADVVAVGLERRAEHGHAHAAEAAVELLAGQVDHPGAAAQVDGVDLAQEAQRLVDAELARRGP